MTSVVILMGVAALLLTIAAIVSKIQLAKWKAEQQAEAIKKHFAPTSLNSLNRKHWR